jgi:hypothetical protein
MNHKQRVRCAIRETPTGLLVTWRHRNYQTATPIEAIELAEILAESDPVTREPVLHDRTVTPHIAGPVIAAFTSTGIRYGDITKLGVLGTETLQLLGTVTV